MEAAEFAEKLYEVNWLLLFREAYTNISINQKFIRNDWETIRKGIKIRYFSSENYNPFNNYSTIWNTMGEDIECILYENKLVCSLPPKKRKMKPLKVFTHGFDETMDGQKIVFLKGLLRNSVLKDML